MVHKRSRAQTKSHLLDDFSRQIVPFLIETFHYYFKVSAFILSTLMSRKACRASWGYNLFKSQKIKYHSSTWRKGRQSQNEKFSTIVFKRFVYSNSSIFSAYSTS